MNANAEKWIGLSTNLYEYNCQRVDQGLWCVITNREEKSFPFSFTFAFACHIQYTRNLSFRRQGIWGVSCAVFKMVPHGLWACMTCFFETKYVSQIPWASRLCSRLNLSPCTCSIGPCGDVILHGPDVVAQSLGVQVSHVEGWEFEPNPVTPMTYKIDTCRYLAWCSVLVG